MYYQFVARGLLPNQQKEYKRLGEICNAARMAGEMDWDYLVDRTRNLVSPAHWASPEALMRSAARQFRTYRWAEQNWRVEVWIEKDAGIGVIENVCDSNDVPFFSCRGYTSVSELWQASRRLRALMTGGQNVVVLHIGDHDPSGLDMSRDIEDRLRTFIRQDNVTELSELLRGWLDNEDAWTVPGFTNFRDAPAEVRADYTERLRAREDRWGRLEVRRIALNYDQVQQYQPPPNPAKSTDARYRGYVDATGLDESWELDALDPVVLQGLIQDAIDQFRDSDVWDRATDDMHDQRGDLEAAAARWQQVVAYLDTGGPE